MTQARSSTFPHKAINFVETTIEYQSVRNQLKGLADELVSNFGGYTSILRNSYRNREEL